jgi:hypothetical protein
VEEARREEASYVTGEEALGIAAHEVNKQIRASTRLDGLERVLTAIAEDGAVGERVIARQIRRLVFAELPRVAPIGPGDIEHMYGPALDWRR